LIFNEKKIMVTDEQIKELGKQLEENNKKLAALLQEIVKRQEVSRRLAWKLIALIVIIWTIITCLFVIYSP